MRLRRLPGRALGAMAAAVVTAGVASGAVPDDGPLRLRELPPSRPTPPAPPALAGEALPPGELDELLGLLPPSEGDVLPPGAAPPTPRHALPLRLDPASPPGPRPPSGALRVVRRQPEGDVPRGTDVAVTFSSPMDTSQQPLLLTPPVEGKFRWAFGGRTLLFEPARPLPAATRFEVEVPGSARAATGEMLSAPVRWGFATLTPRLDRIHPPGPPATTPLGRQPVLLLETAEPATFADLAPLISVVVDGKPLPFREATAVERDREATARGFRDPSRLVALRPVEPLPPDVEAGLCVARPEWAKQRPGWWSGGCFRFRTVEPVPAGPPAPAGATPPFDPLRRGRPAFHLPGDGGMVVVAAPDRTLSLGGIGLERVHVRIHAVTPDDWPAYVDGLEKDPTAYALPEPPGRLVFDGEVTLAPAAGGVGRAELDLGPALSGGVGHAVVTIDSPVNRDQRRFARTWVQVTRVSLDTVAADDALVVAASTLPGLGPLPGVALSLVPDGGTAVTGADGMASLRLPDGLRHDRRLLGRLEKDVAFVPAGLPGQRQITWEAAGAERELGWRLFLDAPWYAAGSHVQLVGWLRRRPGGRDAPPPGAAGPVDWKLVGPDGTEVARGEAAVEETGRFHLDADLPAVLGPGTARLELHARTRGAVRGARREVPVSIRSTGRRPLELRVATTEHPADDGLVLVARALDPAGGGIPGRTIQWWVSPGGPPSSPELERWLRGTTSGSPAVSAWLSQAVPSPLPAPRARGAGLTATTDGAGEHRVEVAVDLARPDAVAGAHVSAAIPGSTASAFLVVGLPSAGPGLRLAATRAFVAAGEPIEVEAVAADASGALTAGVPLRFTATRVDFAGPGGTEVEPATCSTTSRAGPTAARCAFPGRKPGLHLVRARAQGTREDRAQVAVWVAGGIGVPPGLGSHRTESASAVPLVRTALVVPERGRVAPGRPLGLLILSPVFPAEGLLALGRDGATLRRFRVTGPETVLYLTVPAESGDVLPVRVDLLSADLARRATGRAEVAIERPALDVRLEAAAAEGGTSAALVVQVRTPDGRPAAGADVAITVVDAGAGEPFRSTGWTAVYERPRGPAPSALLLERLAGGPIADPEELERLAAADVHKAFSRRAPSPPPEHEVVTTSSDGRRSGSGPRDQAPVVPPASVAPALRAGDDGIARVRLQWPEGAGTVRVHATAVLGSLGGSAGKDVERPPPLLELGPGPGELRTGDRLELPVTLRNPDDTPLAVRLAVRARGAAPESAGRRVTVPPRSTAVVLFPVRAGAPGPLRLEAIAATAAASARAARELVVAAAGPLSASARVELGRGPFRLALDPAVAGAHVEIVAGGGPLQLLEGLPGDELVGCTESLAARLAARAALLSAGIGPATELRQAAARDAAALVEVARGRRPGSGCDDEGMRHARDAVRVAEALAAARAAGLHVPAGFLSDLQARLRRLDVRGESPRDPKARDHRRERAAAIHALAVLHRLGEPDPLSAAQHVRDAGVEALSTAELGWLLEALAGSGSHAELRSNVVAELRRRSTPDRAGRHLRDEAGSGSAPADRHAAEAIALAALNRSGGDRALAAAIRAHLEAVLDGGPPGDAAERSLIVAALASGGGRPLPSGSVLVFVGDRRAGEARPGGPTLRLAAGAGSPTVVLAGEGGPGLTARVALHGATRPVEEGLAVERSFELADGSALAPRKDGALRIPAGAQVRVRLLLAADADRARVGLAEALPAGLVLVEAGTGLTAREGRLEAWLPAFPAGVRTFEYLARAAYRGEFAAPGPSAREVGGAGARADGAGARLVIE